MIIALIAGIVIGFIVAIPPGPATMAMIGRGLEHGYKYGLMVGFGAALSEACYAALGFFGVQLIDSPDIEFVLRIIGIALVLILGIRFTFFSKSYSHQKNVSQKKVQRRKSFVLGYMISIATPTIGAAYIVVANLVHSYNVYPSSNLNNSFATIGAASGAALWMTVLMTLTWKVKQTVNSKIVSYLVIGSGVLLLFFAGYMIYSLFEINNSA